MMCVHKGAKRGEVRHGKGTIESYKLGGTGREEKGRRGPFG